MKRFMLLLALIIIWNVLAGCSGRGIDEYAMITFLVGDVKKNNIEAQIGDIIKENDVIITSEGAFCDIKIGESIVRIKAKSEVAISALLRTGDGESITLGLSSGSMLCKPKKLMQSEDFLIKTPTAVAGVRGTQFSVEIDKAVSTRIKVFEGEVKVAKRIRQFEESVDMVLDIAPAVQSKEKIVITLDDVKKAEAVVETALKAETARGGENEEILERVISSTRDRIVIGAAAIEQFKADDFIRESGEIFAVEEKPREVIVRITRVIQEEKAKPQPEGRLLVTRYDVYFIKDGKILWEGKLLSDPVKDEDKIFVASGDYVFCALNDGPVLWRQNIKNDGKLSLSEGKVVVKAGGRDIPLNPETGERL